MNYRNEIAELRTIKSQFPRGKDGRILYDVSFRGRVIEIGKQHGYGKVARDLRINDVTVYQWKSRYSNMDDVQPVSIRIKSVEKKAVNKLDKLEAMREQLRKDIREMTIKVERIDAVLKMIDEVA
jgi:hypothetical protein